MPITLLELATHRLGREARTGVDFAQAGVPSTGGCEHCGAPVAAYSAHPSRSGYIRCVDCIDEDGWTDVAQADGEIFGDAAGPT